MTPIYHAENTVDAELVLHLLAEAGIVAHVFGSALSGGIGELPAAGLIRVHVADEQAEQARALVQAWQDAPVPDGDELDRLADLGNTGGAGELLA